MFVNVKISHSNIYIYIYIVAVPTLINFDIKSLFYITSESKMRLSSVYGLCTAQKNKGNT